MKQTKSQPKSQAKRANAQIKPQVKFAKSIGIACVWVVLWAVVACAIGSPIILASPYETLVALGASVVEPAFWAAIGGTFWHIAVGLVLACIVGCATGIAAARWRLFGELVSPAMQFIKSAPIVCFIVLMLVWFGSTYIDLVAVLLAVLPVYFFSMSEAYRQRDVCLADMLRVFRVPLRLRLRLFEWPSARPFFTQSTRIAVGMAWKSGVTAELIGLTFASIGEQIYLSKLTLDTAGLLMWTVVIVLLSWASEKLVLAALDRLGSAAPKPAARCATDHTEPPPTAKPSIRGVALCNISKSFGDHSVLDGFSLRCEAGSRTCIMAPTGKGKTTLLSIVMGIEQPDGGNIACLDERGVAASAQSSPLEHAKVSPETPKVPEASETPGTPETPETPETPGHSATPKFSEIVRISAVFQEERLLAQLTAEQNIALIAPSTPEHARQLLSDLLGPAACDMLPSELSGGMKRCVEICRALAAPSECVVMDEPFAGLDDKAKRRAIALIDRELHGRTLLLVTHDATDAAALGCTVVSL